MSVDEQKITSVSSRNGLRQFSTRSSRLHSSAFVFGGIIWFVVYALAARTTSGEPAIVAGEAALVAAFVVSIYFSVLFVAAVGSPIGDIVAPALLAMGTPGFLYRGLLPGETTTGSSVVPFTSEGGFAVPALIVSVFVPSVVVGGAYLIRRRPEHWERTVMPDDFSLVELLNREGEQIRSSPGSAFSLPPMAGSIGVPLFLGLLVPVTLLLVLTPEELLFPGDLAGPFIVVFAALYVHFS